MVFGSLEENSAKIALSQSEITATTLHFVHLCMRGRETDAGGELYKGMAKGAKGYAAEIAFAKAKKEGMHIEVQWQDGDSSSAKSFRENFTDEEDMLQEPIQNGSVNIQNRSLFQQPYRIPIRKTFLMSLQSSVTAQNVILRTVIAY